jgi:hypothetical protein
MEVAEFKVDEFGMSFHTINFKHEMDGSHSYLNTGFS